MATPWPQAWKEVPSWSGSGEPWEEIVSVQSGAERVSSLAWSPDRGAIAHAGEEGSLVVTDVTTSEALATLSQCRGPLTQVAWSPQSDQMATGSAAGLVTVWDTATWERFTNFDTAPNTGLNRELVDVDGLAWSPNGGSLALVLTAAGHGSGTGTRGRSPGLAA